MSKGACGQVFLDLFYGLCCRNYFMTRRDSVSFLLGGDPEQAGDEIRRP